MGIMNVVVPLLYVVPFVIVSALAYLVLRFGIRDGLRAHQRWLDDREPPTAPPAD